MSYKSLIERLNKYKITKILGELNKCSDVNGDNIVAEIQERLKEDKNAFEAWKEENFCLDHMFVPPGYALLHIAVAHDYEKVMDALIKAGADVDVQARDIGEQAPLHLASEHGKARAVKALIEAEANVNLVVNCYGYTALHLAAENGYTTIVEDLKEAEADVNAKIKPHGYTPLYLAVANGHTKTAEYLSANGASPLSEEKQPGGGMSSQNSVSQTTSPGAESSSHATPPSAEKFPSNKGDNPKTPNFFSEHKGKFATGVVGTLILAGAIAAFALGQPLIGGIGAVVGGIMLLVALLAITTEKGQNTWDKVSEKLSDMLPECVQPQAGQTSGQAKG